jgi:hypothetical protein
MGTTSKELLHVLVEHLSPALSDHGYKYLKSKQHFEKKTKDCLKMISPHFDTTSVKGIYNLGFRFNTRINRLEDIINSCKPDKPKKYAKLSLSASGLLFNMSAREYSDWCYSSGEELIGELEIIISEIERYGIGFINKYCHIEELMLCLEEQDCLPLAERRAEALLAVYVCMGEIEKFNLALPVLSEQMSKNNDGFFRESFEQYVSILLEQYPEFKA